MRHDLKGFLLFNHIHDVSQLVFLAVHLIKHVLELVIHEIILVEEEILIRLNDRLHAFNVRHKFGDGARSRILFVVDQVFKFVKDLPFNFKFERIALITNHVLIELIDFLICQLNSNCAAMKRTKSIEQLVKVFRGRRQTVISQLDRLEVDKILDLLDGHLLGLVVFLDHVVSKDRFEGLGSFTLLRRDHSFDHSRLREIIHALNELHAMVFVRLLTLEGDGIEQDEAELYDPILIHSPMEANERRLGKHLERHLLNLVVRTTDLAILQVLCHVGRPNAIVAIVDDQVADTIVVVHDADPVNVNAKVFPLGLPIDAIRANLDQIELLLTRAVLEAHS